MNTRIQDLRVNNIIDTLSFLDSESINRIISAAEVELRNREDEERYRQYEADQVDDFLRQGSMLHGRTNALEGIK